MKKNHRIPLSKKRLAIRYAMPFILAFLAALMIESFSHRSVIGALSFLIFRPHLFLMNVLFLSLLYIPMLAMRRKTFYASIVSALLFALGITDFIVQSMRVTPLEWTDFYVFFGTGFDIIHHYLSPGKIALIIVLIAAAVFALGILFVKLKKRERHLRGMLISLLIATSLTLASALGFKSSGIIPSRFPNLLDAYHTYGFTYCFLGSIFDRGIDEPDEYSEKLISDYAEKAGIGNPERIPDTKPNLVFVQLESFFDVKRIKNFTFLGYGDTETDPIPNFTALSAANPSGYLSVPSIGAGTANTEFEVITGMDLAAFGAGEYPYKTILQDNACESTAYILSDIGYATHAIHNNRATFYDRHKCYTNLGFDSFTSLEYMLDVTEDDYTPHPKGEGWAKDRILTSEILDALRSSGTSDYVYTVSVQGHGEYPSRVVEKNQPFKVLGNLFEDELCAWEYYVNQIHEMDLFIGELTEALLAYKTETGEDTVLVLYGDHLPGGLVGISDDKIEGPSIYATEYVIWSTAGALELPDEDLEAFQLAAVVLDGVGIECGSFARLHQNYRYADDYLDVLLAFQYDALYGERYLYGGARPYTTVDTVFGVNPITIESVTVVGDYTIVTGKNFTAFSKITIDREAFKTELMPDGSLRIKKKAKPGDRVAVAQYTSNNEFLSETEPIYLG